jgi:hypothetical protein
MDARGNLSFLQHDNQIPFEVKRVYWIYDVPGGEQRGGHAFRQGKELIVALSGSFDVIIQNGKSTGSFTLNRSYYGLYIPEMTWRHMENFSTNSLAMIISGSMFDDKDYIRDLEQYNKLINGK